MRRSILLLLSICFILHIYAQEKLDMVMINKIKEEGIKNSKVMDIAFHLTDVNGPRLSGSPGLSKASEWAKAEMTKWGLVNATLEPWGEFGKGWELQKSYVAMTAPYYKPLIAFPKAWTKGTNGLQKAQILLVYAKDSSDLKRYRGQMKDKVILLYRNDSLEKGFEPDSKRLTDAKLSWYANEPYVKKPLPLPGNSQSVPSTINNLINKMAKEEGALAVLSSSTKGRDGTLFVGGSSRKEEQDNILDIILIKEDYLSICRLVANSYPVSIELDVKSTFYTQDAKGYNVIAEISGTDPLLKEELVMIGGHLDSWHGSTGATDNAAGCAVMMEVVRIFKALNIKPRRTIRIALWTGEEQGLLGSRGYIKNHFADPATMELKPDHKKLSVYFNLDNGTGRIRGVFLQGNEKVKNIFAQWLIPFHSMDAKTLSPVRSGGTDHLSFDAVGLPGFQFIQDPIEYDTRTHHTNMDSYDHLIAEDLKQISVIVASFVYNAAMRDEKIPRKELPKPTASN